MLDSCAHARRCFWRPLVLLVAVLLSGCAGLARDPGKVGKSIPYEPPHPSAKQAMKAAPADAPVQAPTATARKNIAARRPAVPKRPAGAICLSCREPEQVLVNKQHPIMDWDVPDDLVEAHIPFLSKQAASRRLLRAPAARAAERLFEAAQAAGYTLYGISGFRSFETQQQVFSNNARELGSAQQANFVSAVAGQSEHQTGLALDLTSAAVGYRLDASFGDTPEGRWLQANAARFGFILRYPKGKESITGYSYEPWHWRYVGRGLAESVTRGNLALEEHLSARTNGAVASRNHASSRNVASK